AASSPLARLSLGSSVKDSQYSLASSSKSLGASRANCVFWPASSPRSSWTAGSCRMVKRVGPCSVDSSVRICDTLARLEASPAGGQPGVDGRFAVVLGQEILVVVEGGFQQAAADVLQAGVVGQLILAELLEELDGPAGLGEIRFGPGPLLGLRLVGGLGAGLLGAEPGIGGVRRPRLADSQ